MSKLFTFHEGPFGWKWVSMGEVQGWVNGTMSAFPIDFRTSLEVFNDYAALSTYVFGKKDFPSWSPDLFKVERECSPGVKEIVDDFFVPAGWALDVVRAAKERVVLTAILHYDATPSPHDRSVEWQTTCSAKEWDVAEDEWRRDAARPDGTIRTRYDARCRDTVAVIGIGTNGEPVRTRYEGDEI